MPKRQRNTVTYDLKQGRRVVYRGTTNNPERREKEHRDEGKQFDHLKVTSRRMTEGGATRKEAQNLETFRRGHSGENPTYNKERDG